VQAATQAKRNRSSASQAMLEILIALTASRGLSSATRVEDYSELRLDPTGPVRS